MKFYLHARVSLKEPPFLENSLRYQYENKNRLNFRILHIVTYKKNLLKCWNVRADRANSKELRRSELSACEAIGN